MGRLGLEEVALDMGTSIPLSCQKGLAKEMKKK